MKVDLIWVTPNAEDLIAYIARVSNPDNQNNPDYAKLIRYMIRHNHWSPFEMASMCLSIKTSRAIGEQLLRHRSFSFQVFSQRYAEISEFEPVEIRKQSEKNRQSSTDVFDPIIAMEPMHGYQHNEEIYASDLVREHLERSEFLYRQLLEFGVAKETARFILPLATQTHIYMAGTLRSWIHYIGLRSQEDVQKEHRDIANIVGKIFVAQFPVISEALGWSTEYGIGV